MAPASNSRRRRTQAPPPRERDPEAFAAAHREEQNRGKRRQAATGLTFAELLRRVGGDRETLAFVLRDEVRRGRIDYLAFSRRYRLNGGLPDDVKLALRELEL